MSDVLRFQQYGLIFSVSVEDLPSGAEPGSLSFVNVLRNSIQVHEQENDRVQFLSLADQMSVSMEKVPEVSVRDHSERSPARSLFISRLQACLDFMHETGLSIQHYRWEADVFVPFEDLGSDVGRLVHSSAAEGLFSDDVKNWGATGLTLMGLSKLDYRMTVRLSHSAEDDESGVRFIISEHRNWSSESTPDFSLQAEAFGERVKHVVHGLSNAARDRE